MRSLFCFCYLFIAHITFCAQAYEIKDFKTELINNGFRISIPAEAGIKMVFYVISINKACPSLMDYIHMPNNNYWTTTQLGTKLQENDNVLVHVLVQHGEELHRAIRHFTVNNNKLILMNISTSDGSELMTEVCTENRVQIETNCERSITEVLSVMKPCVGDLIYEENFDELDTTRWTYDVRLRLYADETEEFTLFDNEPKNSFVKDGFLHIVPTLTTDDIRHGSMNLANRCTAVSSPQVECNVVARGLRVLPPIHSAQLHTKNSFTFKYGRVEIRAKLPKGDWLLPYIMLQPATTHTETYHAPQMRVAFARGNARYLNITNMDIGGSRLYGGVVHWQNVANVLQNILPDLREIKREQHFGDDFHIYSLKWTKDSIELAVDGEVYGEITENLDKFEQTCFLILGVSAGGHLWFEETPYTNKPWLDTSNKAVLNFWLKRNDWYGSWNGNEAMQVDYVRVYAV